MKELLDSWQNRFKEKLKEKNAPKIATMKMIAKERLEILPECKQSYLVFVDGCLDLSLSIIPDGLVALSLEKSLPSYGLFLQNRWNKFLKEEKEEEAILNASFAKDSLFLYVPPKFVPESPLQIHHVFTSNDLTIARIEAILGVASCLNVIQTYQASQHGVEVNHNTAWMATVEAGAFLSVYNHSLFKNGLRSIDSLRAQLKKDAKFSYLHTASGSCFSSVSTQVELMQENSSSELSSLSMVDEKKRFDCKFLARHVAPHCESRQHVKNALLDEGRSSFEGKIYVHPEAQKTQSYQLNKNLILSDLAQAKSQPILEIFADDVKASHGAIVSQLSEEELFYLTSRGLSKEEAKRLLVMGFCREIANLVPVESCKAYLLDEIGAWIK